MMAPLIVRRPISEDFTGTQRFEVLRCLGAGGMGTVYEAMDRERNVRVALKTLRAMNADALLRFKSEFREFQNLAHPNLVSVGELFGDSGEWFFTMELIEGADFLEWVRPGTFSARASTFEPNPSAVTERVLWSPRVVHRPTTPPLNEQRLRDALIQLAEGLCVLHEAQKVHRDIKPSNVLVSRDGRVVILDFGLATDIGNREHRSDVDIVGTVEYMAPEQAAGRQVGPPADWYAVGVVLYEALTGEVPLQGPAIEVLMGKQKLDAPAPSAITPNVPPDLDQLCRDLLRFNPSARPTGREVLKRLGGNRAERRSTTSSLSSFSTSSEFIGRHEEQAQLKAAYQASHRAAQVVCVHGESGLGKSALVRHFTEQLKVGDPHLVVLHGVCYERESVPFKAVDGVIDSLSRYLRRLPKGEAAALLPRKAALLAQVFPVLSRVEAVAEAPRASQDVLDPQELRNRLFASLRELFERLAERRPVVLVIDDLQWADADSLALLGELLRPPDAPPLLLIATMRDTDTESSSHRAEALLEHLRAEVTLLPLDRLSRSEAQELAEALVRRAQQPLDLDASAISREADGHPLFIDELIRHACTVGRVTSGTLQLEDALWGRIQQLDDVSRRLLEIVALAGGRLLQQTAAEAAGLPFGDFAKHAAALRVVHLVRTTGMRGSDSIEPYHDRVRKAVLSHLDAPRLRTYHRRIAVALEITGQTDAEALAIHWREAGELDKAAHFATLAAERARSALAFDRAARFYQAAIDVLGPGHPNTAKLRIALGSALANAGRGADAAAAYLQAAKEAPAADALELRRRAADQLLRVGHFDEALELFRGVREAIGMPLADSPKRALAGLLLSRMRLRLRGLGWREVDESRVAPHDLLRIDTGFGMALALSTVDTIRGADVQTRQLLAALKAGEPYRIACALALEAAFNAAGRGTLGHARTEKLVAMSRRLAERLDNPHALGLAAWAEGSAAYLEGRFALAHELNEKALDIYRNRCTGVAWETASAQAMSLWALHYLGRFDEIQRRLPALLKAAAARGDLYDATNLRTSHTNTVWLASDEPDVAERELEHAMRAWSPKEVHLPHYYALHAAAQIWLYRGDGDAAFTLVSEGWPVMKAALLLELQVIRIELSFLRARAALASGRIDVAARDARLLDREKTPWATALACLVRAGVAAARGDSKANSLYHEAARALEAVDLRLHATVARLRAGDAAAADQMRAVGIRNPDRMAGLYAPRNSTP